MLGTRLQRSVLLGLVALAVVWGLVVWRVRHAEEATVQGDLRVGSLTCPSPCRIELTLTDGTRVRSGECTLPDALRDVPGVRVVAAGKWTEPGTLDASHLFVAGRALPSTPVPSGCSARPR